MKIKHLVFLIHPCPYEWHNEANPEAFRKSSYALYLEREQEVKQRWLAALPSLDKATLFIQYGGMERGMNKNAPPEKKLIRKKLSPEYILEAAKEQLGEPNVCYVSSYSTLKGQWRRYYPTLIGCIHSHMKEFDLEFDPATVTSDLWGGSFEGCAAGYGGAFAEYLGLKRPPKMHFEMMIYDSRFLYGARRWEAIPLSGSDIEAWLFELHDGTGAAIFQARLSAQWLDKRPILLHLNPQRMQVCNTQGYTVWPPAPGDKWLPDEFCPYCLTTSDTYWVRTVRMAFNDFREVIAAAMVVGC